MYLKRIITYSSLCLIALSWFLGVRIESNTSYNTIIPVQISIVDTSYAATTPATPKKWDPTSTKALESYNQMIDTLNIALGVLSVLVSPVILFVGWLMSPDWTSGDLFGLRAPMYTLWVTVSNVVYFIYAILLILIALGTMFNQDKFSYKVMLPKLALGILMVPFTWWFVQWTISISTVVTASVMSIPKETMAAIEAKSPSPWFSTTASIPKSITIGSGATESWKCPWECITPKEFLNSSAGIYGPLVVYWYSIFKFQKIERLDWPDIASAALKIVHTSIVSTIMFAVFGILIVALAAMLIVRAVKLWMYAIFSPLFTFQFVAGSSMMGENKDTFTLKEFMGLVFVPAIVWLALSFGLIMIAAVQSTNTWNSWTKTDKCNLLTWCNINIMWSPNNSVFRKWEKEKDGYKTTTTFTWGAMKVNFLGKASNQADPNSTTQWTIDSAGGMFGTIIIDLIALVFIWVAFMAAKNVSSAVKAAVSPFEAIGSKIGKLATNMPQYMPLPSVMWGSVRWLGMATQKISEIPEKMAAEKYDNSQMGQFLNNSSGSLSQKDVANLASSIREKDGKTAIEKVRSEFTTIQARGEGAKLATESNKENMNELAKRVKEGQINQQNLRDAYGLTRGDQLYEILNKWQIDNKEELKILAAILANKDKTIQTRITTSIDAENFLKNKTPSAPSAEAKAWNNKATAPNAPAGGAPNTPAGGAPNTPAGGAPNTPAGGAPNSTNQQPKSGTTNPPSTPTP